MADAKVLDGNDLNTLIALALDYPESMVGTDAQAAARRLKRVLESLTEGDAIPAAEQVGREAPSPAWVDCKERLPETGVDVLVLDGSRGTCHVVYLHPKQPRLWYPGGWAVEWTSHWMPLPSPPSKLCSSGCLPTGKGFAHLRTIDRHAQISG